MKQGAFKKLLSVGIILFLLTFLCLTGLINPLEKITGKVAEPFQKLFYHLNLQSPPAETQKLEEKIQELTYQIVELNNLKQENELLRKNLNFFQENNYAYQLANIIGATSLSYLPLDSVGNNIFIIDKGAEDNLKPGYPVIVPHNQDNKIQGFLIGKITKVNSTTAEVVSILDAHSKITAKNLNADPATGLVSGEYGLSLKMDFIPLDKEIKMGDLIVTYGLEKNIPSQLIIGEVSLVEETNPQKIFKSAQLKTLIPFENLSVVTVLIPKSIN